MKRKALVVSVIQGGLGVLLYKLWAEVDTDLWGGLFASAFLLVFFGVGVSVLLEASEELAYARMLPHTDIVREAVRAYAQKAPRSAGEGP